LIVIQQQKLGFVVDDGKDKWSCLNWGSVKKCIPLIKRSPEEGVYIREGSRLEKIKV
jgi:hypothetical protein